MTIGKLIFFNGFPYRLTRHILFWCLYCTFFFTQSIVPSRENDFLSAGIYMIALTSTGCFIPACALLFYTGLYVIWPYFLKRKKYLVSFFAVLAMFGIAIAVNYFFSGIFHTSYYVVNSPSKFDGVLNLAYLNAIWAVTLMGLGLFVKLSKECFMQQKENIEIARKKVRTELNIEKSRLQPAYLYGSLDNIQSKIVSASQHPDQMILKLSDVLSYTLYECEVEFVPVNTELAAIIDFIDLEKMKNNGREQILIEWDISEEFLVPPMLILSFLQEVVTMFKQCGKLSWQMAINITEVGEQLEIVIAGNAANGFPDLTDSVKNILNRLDSIYERNDYSLNYSTAHNEYLLDIRLLEKIKTRKLQPLDL